MARAQFDKQQILEQASNAFWRFGYHATSMQTVFEATGLKPGSIYLAFNNKEGLFKASLEYYTQQSLSKLTAHLSQAKSTEEGICKILMEFVEESCQADFCSCFLVKSQLELSDEKALQACVSAHLKQIESLYFSYLNRTYETADAASKATSLMLHIFGMRVYGYHNQSREQILGALQIGLPWLPWSQMKH